MICMICPKCAALLKNRFLGEVKFLNEDPQKFEVPPSTVPCVDTVIQMRIER